MSAFTTTTIHDVRRRRVSGPTLESSDRLHEEKYRGEGEDFREFAGRVASASTEDRQHYQQYRELLLSMHFLPGGRQQAAMGSLRDVTAFNCFVSGVIEDSAVEGNGCIFDRVKEAFSTMRKGGGIGYDFSTLRPRGSQIKKLQSQASGPISFMKIFNETGLCAASSGHRRGAQMGVLRIDHPDIEEFIHLKQSEGVMTGFNISVAVTDEFMQCLENGQSFPLKFAGQVHKGVDAQALWEMLMRSTYDWADPGVIFIDTINRLNNLWYCETIAATNPCGEQPLPPYGACLLGSLNLVKYLRKSGTGWELDWDLFSEHMPIIVRALDNVINKSKYPLYEQEKESRNKRRMGIGVTGLANCIEALGLAYGSDEFLQSEYDILRCINREAYLASVELAKERGPFPLFDAERYCRGEYIKRLDEDVQELIQHHGIRNSHLTSIAPTGTISMCADNVSSGIEPVFQLEYERPIKSFHGERIETIQDYGYRVLGVKGRQTHQVSVKEHLDVLGVAQLNVDSAVTKTCNVPENIPWEEFKEVYRRAWVMACKGCTTFREGGAKSGLLIKKEDDGELIACRVDPQTGRKECE